MLSKMQQNGFAQQMSNAEVHQPCHNHAWRDKTFDAGSAPNKQRLWPAAATERCALAPNPAQARRRNL